MTEALGDNDQEVWLTTAAFAATAGITERAARKALARAFEGKPWRGKALIVRKVPSRGGAAGWAFEVLADSVHGDAEGALPAVPAASTTTAVPPAPSSVAPPPAPQPSPTSAGALQRYESGRATSGCTPRRAAPWSGASVMTAR